MTVARATGSIETLSVLTFRLARPYRAALFPKVVAELDDVARNLAAELKGTLDRTRPRHTVTVAGRRARQYQIAYDGRVERVTFVLEGLKEYELLCRWDAARPERGEGACADFVASFRLA